MEVEASGIRKRRLRLITGLFVAMLIVFTLAGNTFRAYSLPKVYTSTVSNGSLTHSFEGSATIQASEVQELLNPGGWKVAKVLVKLGDEVHSGQTLIQYDDSDSMLQLADQQLTLKKLELSMGQLEANFLQAANGEDEAAKSSAAAAIESAKLDIASQKQHIQHFLKSIAANRQITAPFDGVVTEIHAVAGFNSTGGPDIRLSNAAKGFRIQLAVPGDIASLLTVGETLDQLTISGAEDKSLTGTITDIEVASSGNGDSAGGFIAADSRTYNLTVAVQGDEVKGGERVQVKLAKSANQDGILVPNNAIHKDDRGAYVYTLRAEEGPLGNAYYVVQTPVKINDTNEYVSAVTGGLFDQQEVIINSSDFIIDGIRVRR